MHVVEHEDQRAVRRDQPAEAHDRVEEAKARGIGAEVGIDRESGTDRRNDLMQVGGRRPEPAA